MILPWLLILQEFLWLHRLHFGPVKPGCIISLMLCMCYEQVNVLNICFKQLQNRRETRGDVKWANTPKDNLNKVCWVYSLFEYWVIVAIWLIYNETVNKLCQRRIWETFGTKTGRCGCESNRHLSFC